MSKRFKTVDSLQKHLKHSIYEAIEHRLLEVVIRTIQRYIKERVYDTYIPQGEFAYNRTYELLDAVSIGNFKMGSKYATFEIYMDSDKLGANITDDGYWNQHANVWGGDETENIPLWIEEGTSGSLWDREGAHYMEQSWVELSGGRQSLAQILASELKREGWDVKFVS
jgi:hypothetical protein